MSQGHFSTSGAYTRDPRTEYAALMQAHDQRLTREAREDRAAKWIAGKMVGQTYEGFGEMLAAAVGITELHYGRELTTDEHELLTRACRPLFAGLTPVETIAPTRCVVTRSPVYCVSFQVAA